MMANTGLEKFVLQLRLSAHESSVITELLDISEPEALIVSTTPRGKQALGLRRRK